MSPRLFPTRTLLLALICASAMAAAPPPPPIVGRKYVLSVGITAYRDKALKGCVNDATGVRDLLVESFGFDRAGATLLANDAATRAGILRAIQSYVETVSGGDMFVFFYSGHGTLFPDDRSPDRDETETLDLSWLRARQVDIPDGRYDSAIVPIDAGAQGGGRPWGNLILDDELFALFSRMTARGATVILISDSCHSGSLSRSFDLNGTPKFLDPETALGAKLSGLPAAGATAKSTPRDFQGRYLSMTSSQDNQVSIDSEFEGRPQGMFTFALKGVIREAGNSIDYRTLMENCRALINHATRGVQTPRLDARYYRGSLNEPVFSLPSSGGAASSPEGAAASGSSARLRLIVRGRAGEAIAESSLALFKPGITSVPKQITPADTLVILRTGANGEAVSEPLNVRPGEYRIKVVCVGYRTFTGKVRLAERDGLITLLVTLDPE